MQLSFKRLLLLPYKATFHPPLVYLREPYFNLRRAVRQQVWLAAVRSHTIKIASPLETKGRDDFFECIELATGCVVETQCSIWLAEEPEAQPKLTLKERVYCGRNAYFGCYAPIEIGADSLIGAYSYLISGNHRFDDIHRPIRLQGYQGKAIHVGADVWIGCHVVILPGVTIGDGAVVAAGAVVNRSVPAYEIWGGVPARKIGNRGETSL